MSGPRHPQLGQGRPPAGGSPESAFLAVVSEFMRRLLGAPNGAVARQRIEAAADDLTNTFPDRLPQTAPMLWGDLLFGFREGRPTLFTALELAQMVLALLSLAVSPPPGDHNQEEGEATIYAHVAGLVDDFVQDEIAPSVVISSGIIGGNGDHAQDQVSAGISVLQVAAAGDHAQDQVSAGLSVLLPAAAGDHAQDQVNAGVALVVAAGSGDHSQDQVAAGMQLTVPAGAGDHAQDHGAAAIVLAPTLASGDHAQDEIAAGVSIVPAGGGYVLDSLSSGAQANVVLALSSARRLTSSYSGSLIRLRRVSDSVESDFGYDGSGDLDVASIASWVGSGDATLVTIYDQSGNGNDMTQSNASQQADFVVAGTIQTCGGQPAPYSTDTSGGDGVYLGPTVSGVPLGAADFAIWVVHERLSGEIQPLYAAQFADGNMLCWGNDNTFYGSGIGGYAYPPRAAATALGSTGGTTDERKCILANFDVDTQVEAFINSTSSFGTNGIVDGADYTWRSGGFDAGYHPMRGPIAEIVVFDGGLLDSSDRSVLMTDGTSYFT